MSDPSSYPTLSIQPDNHRVVGTISRLITSTDGVSVDLDNLSDEARAFLEESIPVNTRKAMENDWASFHSFCKEHGYQDLPAHPTTLIEYMTSLAATHKTSSIERHLSSIARIHRLMGLTPPNQHPTVKSVWTGIRHKKGRNSEGKSPLLLEHVKKILPLLSSGGLCNTRNRALLMVGFSAGLRRSELCGLTTESIKMAEDGLVLSLGRTKTDQEGRGRTIAIPKNARPEFCAVDAYQRWMDVRGDTQGYLWLQTYKNNHLLEKPITPFWVSKCIKSWASKIGLDADLYSGHSLRTGLVTSLAMAGVDLFEIQRFVGHGKVETTLRYVRIAEMFTNNPHTKLQW